MELKKCNTKSISSSSGIDYKLIAPLKSIELYPNKNAYLDINNVSIEASFDQKTSLRQFHATNQN
jgi:hypothetical protein